MSGIGHRNVQSLTSCIKPSVKVRFRINRSLSCNPCNALVLLETSVCWQEFNTTSNTAEIQHCQSILAVSKAVNVKTSNQKNSTGLDLSSSPVLSTSSVLRTVVYYSVFNSQVSCNISFSAILFPVDWCCVFYFTLRYSIEFCLKYICLHLHWYSQQSITDFDLEV